MKEKIIAILLQILSAVVTGVIIMGGWGLGYFTADGNTSVWIALTVVFAFIMIAAAVANIILNKKFLSAFDRMSATETLSYRDSLKSKIESDYAAAEKDIKRKCLFAYLYVIALLIIAFMFSFSFGRIYVQSLEANIFVNIIVIFLMWGVVHIFFEFGVRSVPPKENMLAEADYPHLYEIAKRAASVSGCSLNVILYLNSDSVSVTQCGKSLLIYLDYLTVSAFTREEMYNILLHECAHYTHDDLKRSMFYTKMRNRWTGAAESVHNPILQFACTLFYMYFSTRIFISTYSYEFISSRYHEIQADSSVKTLGDGSVFADAAAKGFCLEEYRGYLPREIVYDFFEPEQPQNGYASLFVSLYKKYYEANKDLWLTRLKRELPAKIDSHPTARMRIAAMGCEEIDENRQETDGEYLAECDKFVKACDDVIYTQMTSGGYEDFRNEAYVSRKAAIDAYEKLKKENASVPDNTALAAARAYNGLDTDKALEIVNDLLEKGGNGANASMIKGYILFDRDDPDCVAYFKTAAEYPEYTGDAYSAIGSFALKTGDEKLLEEYRAEAPKQMDTAHEKESASDFSDSVSVTLSDMDKDTEHELVKGILDIGKDKVDEIHICKYEDVNGVGRYPLCIKFRRRAVYTDMEAILNSVSSFLLTFSDRYSVSVYTGGKAVKRICALTGSLIYERKNASAYGF